MRCRTAVLIESTAPHHAVKFSKVQSESLLDYISQFYYSVDSYTADICQLNTSKQHTFMMKSIVTIAHVFLKHAIFET